MIPMEQIYTLHSFPGPEMGGAPIGLPETFLAPVELEKLTTMRFPKRRDDWLLGRWTAKRLLKYCRPEFNSLSLREIEITNAPSGAPVLRFPSSGGLGVTVSISHSNGAAFCALNFNPDLRIGADLEWIETRFAGLVGDYFTEAEASLVNAYPAGQRDIAVNLVWSIKESMLKSLNLGLRLDTRKIEVLNIGEIGEEKNTPAWLPIEVASQVVEKLNWLAWWKQANGFVVTLSAASARPYASGNIILTGVEAPLAG
jgi:4'-phosphopantetheinyl transferase